MEIESQSKVSSKISSRSSNKKVIQDNSSDNISMSQLELLANRKKLNKKSEEFSIDLDKKSTKVSSKKEISVIKSKSVSSRRLSTDSSSSISDYKRDKRKINKENKNEITRKEKNEMLFKLYTIIDKSNGRWSSNMTIDNSLDEIRSEFSRIKATLDNEGMVKFCKHGLVMGIKGVEMLNNSYDPLGVDLDGWGEAMSYNMSTTEYDEVLAELCDKYKGTGTMSPEIKLLVMIVMSGAMFSFSKKAASDPNILTNIMSSFMGKSKPQPPQQQYQPPQQQQQQQYQQQQQPPQQQQQQQYQQQQQEQSRQSVSDFNREQLRMQQMQQMQQNQNDVESEDSDNIPSKFRGPGFTGPDSINIENIINTMKQKTKEKENPKTVKSTIDIDNILNGSDSDEERIPIRKPRGKGRPPKKTKIIKSA
jgi:hypothetical protein